MFGTTANQGKAVRVEKENTHTGAVNGAIDENCFGKKPIGPTYNMLKPEVKTCLDKVMYQLDLCKNTLGLLERRISNSEGNLQHIMEFVRTEDINYVSQIQSTLTSLFSFFSNQDLLKLSSTSLMEALIAQNISPSHSCTASLE